MIGWVLGLGAVLLLGYETYTRLLSPSPTPKPGGGGPVGPAATGPSAADPTGFEHPPRFLASPMRLAKGQRYRFRYFANKFDPHSFWSNVTAYASEADLPADWPAETRGALDPNTHFAAGTWANATGNIDAPDGLLQTWPTVSTA